MATVNIVRQWLPPLIFARLSSRGRFVGTLAVRSHDVLGSFVRGLHATGLAVKVLVRPHAIYDIHDAACSVQLHSLQALASESTAAKDANIRTYSMRHEQRLHALASL